MSFDAPQSRNEAILQNILGANNVLGEPQSRIEVLLMQILEQGGGGADKEDVSNKVTSLSAESTNVQYPSAKCVYDLVGNVEAVLADLIGGESA